MELKTKIYLFPLFIEKRNNAPKVKPSIVINKLINDHLVEQTRYFLFPIFSTEKVKIENMGIKAYEGHLFRMVSVFLHPQLMSKRANS